MKTLNETELDSLTLSSVKSGEAAGIADVERIIYPIPTVAQGHSLESWRAADVERNLVVYGIGRDGKMAMPYSSTLASRVAQSFIRLTKSGKLREHISGWGYSTYSANP